MSAVPQADPLAGGTVQAPSGIAWGAPFIVRTSVEAKMSPRQPPATRRRLDAGPDALSVQPLIEVVTARRARYLLGRTGLSCAVKPRRGRPVPPRVRSEGR